MDLPLLGSTLLYFLYCGDLLLAFAVSVSAGFSLDSSPMPYVLPLYLMPSVLPPMPFILLLCLQSSPYAFCLGTMPSILPPYALCLATLCLQFFSLCLVSCPYAFSCHIYYWWLALPSQNTHNHWVPLLHGDHGIAPVPSINPGTCGKPVTFLNVIHAPFTVFVVFYFI